MIYSIAMKDEDFQDKNVFGDIDIYSWKRMYIHVYNYYHYQD